MKKEITIRSGATFIITDELPDFKTGIDSMDEYLLSVLANQKANCGYYVLYPETNEIVDNEYDLNEVYDLINNGRI